MRLLGLEKKTLLSSVTSSGAGSAFAVERSKGWTFVIESDSVSSGATVAVEAYIGDGWRTIDSRAITSSGNIMIRDADGHYEKIRASVSNRVDGTYSVYATGTVASL
jgi:hypothetical protein